MSYYVFDNISMGILTALALEVIAVFLYNTSEWRWRKLFLTSGFILAGLFMLTDLFVETNREQLERITRTIVRAAQNEQTRDIAFHLSPNLLIGGRFDKKQVVSVLNNWFQKDMIESNLITRLQVDQDKDQRGRVLISVVTRFAQNGSMAAIGIVKTRWQIDFQKINGQPYKIIDLKNTAVNDSKGIDWVTFKIP